MKASTSAASTPSIEGVTKEVLEVPVFSIGSFFKKEKIQECLYKCGIPVSNGFHDYNKYPETCFQEYKIDVDSNPFAPRGLPHAFSLESTLLVSTSISAEQVLEQASMRRSHPELYSPLFDEAAPFRVPRLIDENTLFNNLENPSFLEPCPLDVNGKYMSSELQEFLKTTPIALIKGAKINLDLFSSAALLKVDPKMRVELRYQFKQLCDENVDERGNKTWKCFSKKSETKLEHYYMYQQSFNNNENDQKTRAIGAKYRKLSESVVPKKKKDLNRETPEMIKFGTNIDLSDEKKWKPQLAELEKFPDVLKLEHSSNMLSHLKRAVQGMNKAQMYMKIPGVRTPAHQENNSIASVNLNIGPGNCMWYAVENEYWGVIHRMCKERGIHSLKESYWPDIEELKKEGIPVYRFEQEPGDVVWVGYGCIHWVQALGVCNNIAWNVAPITIPQMSIICETYERNKHEGFRSLVPVQHMFWQLAKTTTLKKEDFEFVRGQLIRSLAFCKMTSDWAKKHNKNIKMQTGFADVVTVYCTACQVEVFNIFFYKTNKANCAYCAMEANIKNFTVSQQYEFGCLKTIYDSMKLQKTS